MQRPQYPSSKISHYSNKVLNDLGFKEPPIDLDQVLDYYGLSLHQLSDAEYNNICLDCGLGDFSFPTLLLRESGEERLLIKRSGSEIQKRFGIFHACGHYAIPWHNDADYFCDCENIDLSQTSNLEREATEFALNLLFPAKMFLDDLSSLPTCINTIEVLAERYQAPFEATAINYVRCHPGLCALLYLLSNPLRQYTNAPFMVRGSIQSKTFHGQWKPGNQVNYHESFVESLNHGYRGIVSIPSAVFESTGGEGEYLADIIPYLTNQLCVLLMRKDTQISLL